MAHLALILVFSIKHHGMPNFDTPSPTELLVSQKPSSIETCPQTHHPRSTTMRATTLMSALLLLLISPAFAAPLVKRQGGVSAILDSVPQQPDAEGCTNGRRSLIPFWPRQYKAVNDCSFEIGSGSAAGATWRFDEG